MTGPDLDAMLGSSLETAHNAIGFGSGYGDGNGYGNGSGSGFGNGFGNGSGDGGGDFWGGGCGRGGTNSNDGEERYEVSIPDEHDDNEKGTP